MPPDHGCAVALLRATLATLALMCCTSGCTMTRFLAQAAAGQWELSGGVTVDSALKDPHTDARTRSFLSEAVRVKRFALKRGLNVEQNYSRFVGLEREYVVYFVNGSDPLSFTPRAFWFPIVGTFPGLGWFHEADARRFARSLEAEGLDVNVRGVSAFSTGGWFSDPIVSSMFYDHPAARGFLVNTLLHESVHATLLIANQQYFNESVASYVGDRLAEEYLATYLGQNRALLAAYDQALKRGKTRADAMVGAYHELNNLYLSFRSDDEKLQRKRSILARLKEELELEQTPNNATLIGFQLYQEGSYEFDQLLGACDHNWQRFLRTLSGLDDADFAAPQTPYIGPPVLRLARAGCPAPAEKATLSLLSKPLRQRRARLRRRGRDGE